MSIPTVAEVDAIAAIADPVVRNLRITQCYHELSRAIALRTGASSVASTSSVPPWPGANWCTFATWASRQAGQTIRGEDFARMADELFGDPRVSALLTDVARLAASEVRGSSADALVGSIRRVIDPEGALRRAADAVAIGNRKVFAEIGREFARWLGTAAPAGPPTAAQTEAFCSAFRPGEPPDGQRLLREAFAAYGDACAAADPDARAERLLLANLLIGLHEQTRLQPEIAASLDAALDASTVKQRLLALLLPAQWLRARAAMSRWLGRPMPLDVAIDALLAAVRRRMRVLLTEAMMTLRLPGTVVHLARDVQGPFPAELARVDHPALRSVLVRVDPTPDSTAGSGAADWADLPDRMHFIADLFRCWHARPELDQPPYDAAQVRDMKAGRRPSGRL